MAQEAPLPGEGRRHDPGQVLVPGRPVQGVPNALRGRHQLGRIPGAAGRLGHRELHARDPGDLVQHFPDAEAAAVAAVERGRGAAAAQVIERLQVRSVDELLTRVPGVSVTRSGGPASLTGVFLRGTTSSKRLTRSLPIVGGARAKSIRLRMDVISSVSSSFKATFSIQE